MMMMMMKGKLILGCISKDDCRMLVTLQSFENSNEEFLNDNVINK